jgi:2-haloacid dehalogenase
MTVRALVFDVFGTLVDWRSGVADAFRAAGLGSDGEALADAWRARYPGILADVNEGRRAWGDFDELHLETLDAVLAAHDRAAADDVRRELVAAWHRLDPWPDVADGLLALRAVGLTATLSNGHIRLLADLARHGDLRFDTLLSAELFRAYKPAPEVYRGAAALLGVEPSELMLVAAHPWDLAGARAAGLRTALVDRPLELGEDAEPRSDPDADLTVASLPELAEQLSTSLGPGRERPGPSGG